MQTLSFYSRFREDIQAHKKTITIRDIADSNVTAKQLVNAITNPDGKLIGRLRIERIYPIAFEQLNDLHAKQENMSLLTLRSTIEKIYPNQQQFFVIEFTFLD